MPAKPRLAYGPVACVTGLAPFSQHPSNSLRRRLPPQGCPDIFRFLRHTEPKHTASFSRWSPSLLDRTRRLSVAFLEREGETWACFLVTALGLDRRWYGYFSFRPKDGDTGEDEVRTADIFHEASESEIHRKARGLGRPLLSGLLSSALHTRETGQGGSPRLRRTPQFRRWKTVFLRSARQWPRSSRGIPHHRTTKRESSLC